MIGTRMIHPAFKWIWTSKCQMKHKVFFWLLLKDRLSTKDILRRKNMQLDSYTCELCILQKIERTSHLFFRCRFAKACWNSIGISFSTTRNILQIISHIKRALHLPFAMDIIILMTWSIWSVRNAWMFNNDDPTILKCKDKFVHEFNLLTHRVKQSQINLMEIWLQSF